MALTGLRPLASFGFLSTVEHHLSGSWLSVSPFIGIGLALRVNLSRIPRTKFALKLPVMRSSTVQCYGFNSTGLNALLSHCISTQSPQQLKQNKLSKFKCTAIPLHFHVVPSTTEEKKNQSKFKCTAILLHFHVVPSTSEAKNQSKFKCTAILLHFHVGLRHS
jgi:hypothetical protein